MADDESKIEETRRQEFTPPPVLSDDDSLPEMVVELPSDRKVTEPVPERVTESIPMKSIGVSKPLLQKQKRKQANPPKSAPPRKHLQDHVSGMKPGAVFYTQKTHAQRRVSGTWQGECIEYDRPPWSSARKSCESNG